MTTAAELTALLAPHAQRGNTIAAAFLARLEAAEDPDAEAEAIIADIGRMIAALAEVYRRLIAGVGDTLVEMGKALRRAAPAPRLEHHGIAINIDTSRMPAPTLIRESIARQTELTRWRA